jgi:phenylacetate-CoA ligase
MDDYITIKDTIPAAEIESLQFKKLQQLLVELSLRSPYYRGLFAKHSIDPGHINSLDDFRKIPATHKSDLASHNRDFYGAPADSIADYCTTSGTTGSPVTIPLTESDLQRLAINEAGSFAIAGLSSSDTAMLMLTMDRMFMAGMAYFLGLRKMGAAAIRSGSVSPQMQWEQISRFQPTVLIAVPSFLLKMLDYAVRNETPFLSSKVHTIICIGEPIRHPDLSLNVLAQEITRQWPVKLISTYASSEMQTAFTECGTGGNHLQPELIYAELLGEDDEPVIPGEAGEVTITTFGIEGLPLLRYRTGDICRQITGPCGCGRNTMRLSPVIGRKNQMIKLKGTTIFPPAIEDALHQVKGIADYLIEITKDGFDLDEVTIHIVSSGDNGAIEGQLKSILQTKLRVIPELRFTDNNFMLQMRNSDSRKPVKVLFR